MWDNYCLERLLLKRGYRLIAGLDEVGRGALAGPVFSAAVVLDPFRPIAGITDSKLLTPLQRNLLATEIKANAVAFSLGIATESEIDRINILQATIQSMIRAIQTLSIGPELLLLDAVHISSLAIPQISLVKGDYLSASIGAASIIAKVARDEFMNVCSQKHPLYNFSSNKGYGTREHLEAIALYGPCELHRRTFGGVKESLGKGV